jgi:hypothetical protein
MPTIKNIHMLHKRGIQAVDFASMPVILYSNNINQPKQFTPGAMLPFLAANGAELVKPSMLGSGDVPLIDQFLERLSEQLDEILGSKEFVIPPSTLTATQVNAMMIEEDNRMRPLLVRLETEFLNKVVHRTLKLLDQLGELPPFPYEQVGISPEELPFPIEELNISFAGHMAKMQKRHEIMEIESFIQTCREVASINPLEVADNAHLGEALREISRILQFNPAICASAEEAAARAQAREEERMQQMALQNQAVAVDSMRKVHDMGIDVAGAMGV